MIRYFVFALIAFLKGTALSHAAEPAANTFCRPLSAFYRDQRLPSRICVSIPGRVDASGQTPGTVTLIRDGVVLDRQNFTSFPAQGKGNCNRHTGECNPGRPYVAVVTADPFFSIHLNISGLGRKGTIFTGTVTYLPDRVVQSVQ